MKTKNKRIERTFIKKAQDVLLTGFCRNSFRVAVLEIIINVLLSKIL